MDVIIQFWIACTGLTAVLATQQPIERFKRFAPIFGMLGQPAWLYATWKAGQVGMFVLCCAYTLIWGFGFYNAWIRKPNK